MLVPSDIAFHQSTAASLVVHHEDEPADPALVRDLAFVLNTDLVKGLVLKALGVYRAGKDGSL